MLVVHARARIFGTANSWSLSARAGYAEGRDCDARLEISGDVMNGYHLVITPEGFFTADSWYKTLDEALASASELFGVAAHNWKNVETRDSPNTSLERTHER